MSPPQPEPVRLRNPWWIPPFLGRVPAGVEPRHLSLLGLVALALLFENYDLSLLGAALKHISEDLAIAEADLGDFTARVRLGALAVIFVIPLADRIGRRIIFLVSVIGLSVGTFATAFSQTPEQFVWIQMLTRTFMVTAGTVAFVIVAEEFPAAHRGWGMGMLGALAAIGHGLGAAAFAAVDVLPYGWRALYAFGLAPLIFLPLFRRGVTETARFSEQRLEEQSLLAGWFAPLVDLARHSPARAGLLALVALVVTAGHAAVFQFIGLHVLRYRGWEPWQFSVMFVLGGAIGIIGNVVAGRLGDRIGRRAVGFLFMAPFPVFAWAFYAGPAFIVPPFWIVLVFTVSASNVIIRAFATELFPTRHRGTSTGWISITETLGAFLGLTLVSAGMYRGLELDAVAPMLAVGSLAGAALVLLFPETRAQELEALSDT